MSLSILKLRSQSHSTMGDYLSLKVFFNQNSVKNLINAKNKVTLKSLDLN